MSSAESNKMSRKTPSQDSNFNLIWMLMDQIEPLTPVTAKKVDDWWFDQEVLNTTKWIHYVEEEDYPNPWRYMGSVFNRSDVRDFYGFVYNITNLQNERQYIGRKYFWQKRKPRSKDSTVKRRRVTSESNWRDYYGSCPELKQDVEKYGKESFRRTIPVSYTHLTLPTTERV